jgi:hypothetical protein
MLERFSSEKCLRAGSNLESIMLLPARWRAAPVSIV